MSGAANGAVTYLGLDLAWSERNRSGVAVIDEAGSVLAATSELRSDEEILFWIRGYLAKRSIIGIDMPTIVPNETGERIAEKQLRVEFARYNAAAYPANRALAPFRDGGRARRIIDKLKDDGVTETLPLAPQQSGRFALEVYPHPAHIRLFGLKSVFEYKKKKRRSWSHVCSEWSRYRTSLESLRAADPPLIMPDSIPLVVTVTRYKRWEDMLDAITCAYLASYFGRWGTSAPHSRVFGDIWAGYIVVPMMTP